MVQELGETVDAMLGDDEKAVQAVLNRRPSGHYWIVMHHKPTREKLDSGEMVIRKVIKDYNIQPPPLIGTIILEVKDGSIVNEQVNIHDMPIDWWAVAGHAGSEINPYVQKRSDIGEAYIYNV